MAPESSFTLSEYSTTISSGYSQSRPVKLQLNYTEEFAEGTTYCIPVNIKEVSAMKVLKPSRTLFIVLNSPVISKAIYLGKEQHLQSAILPDGPVSFRPQAADSRGKGLYELLPDQRSVYQLYHGH